eukprot:2098407-Ditylum_brightwellii.AAC.1
MDLIPDILVSNPKRGTSGGEESKEKNNGGEPVSPLDNPKICIITGKKAKYRDPKTMKGYHDKEAFAELRRRLEAGEALYQPNALVDKKKKKLSGSAKKRKVKEEELEKSK